MKNRRVTLTIIITAIIALLIGATIAASAFFVYRYFNNNLNPSLNTNLAQQQKKEYVLFDDYKSQAEIHEDEPKIVEYSLNTISDPQNPKFYLGDEGIKILKDKIKNNIGYGPEMFLLDSIIIGNEKLITDEADGEYLSNTNQIIINLSKFKHKEWIPFDESNPSLYLETKVNSVFEVIFHEYQHHLAYVYLNSLKDSDTNSTITLPSENNRTLNPLKIFGYNESLYEQNWNTHFVKWFKKLLNYDKETSKTPFTASVITNHSEPIANYFNQKDLFEIANFQSNRKYWNFSESLKSIQAPTQIKRFFQEDVIFQSLDYLYSLDELVARKYQQLNQIYDSYPENPQSRFFKDGFITTNQSRNYSDIAFNTFLYQDTFDTEYFPFILNQKTTSILKTKRFQFDAPFENEIFDKRDSQGVLIKSYPQDLYNLMQAHMGHVSTFNFSEELPANKKDFVTYLNSNNELIKDGADISFMWRPNNSHLTSISELKGITINNIKNNNLIKFGGYINNDPQNPLVGISFDNSHTTSEVFVSDFTYKRKDKLVTNKTLDLENDVEKHFYVTKNWIEASEITNQAVYFVFEDGTRTPLKTIRENEFGTPSTYIPFLTFNDKSMFSDNVNLATQFFAKKNINNEIVIGQA